MKALQPVIWMKGTFLSPQYLQTQDRFIENTLQFQLNALGFRPWGFRELTLDQEALSGGFAAISRAAGIFPDGLLFDIPDSDAGPGARPLADQFDEERDSLDVYLGIPDFRDHGVNVAAPGRETDTRYVAEVSLLRDENTGSGEKPVQIARKNFRLLFEGEARQGCASLRVARIRKTEGGAFQPDPAFVPPLLNIEASDYLMSIARRLVEILAAKSSVLSGTRRHKNLSLADFGTADIASFWLLYAINSHFPIVQHIFETRRGHPDALYRAMASLAGALTTFSPNIHPRDIPAYDHDDLSATFTPLDEMTRTLLETVVPSNFVSLPLKEVQQSIYATALADDKYLQNTRLYLAVSADAGEADLITKTPYLVKVCSANHIEHLVRQALPGVPLTHTPKPPGAIPVKLNYQYFSLNQTGPAWEEVRRARNLAAYVPGDFPHPELELIVLLPEKR
jgi:type VI secretion system protein ImpJ